MKSSALLKITIVLLVVITFQSCAPSGVSATEYGFFYGVWHGICVPFAVIGKIFKMDVGLYAVVNTGTWYWIGYFIGLLIIGVGSRSTKRR